MNTFDHLNNLTAIKKEFNFNDDEIKKSYNRYLINRYISSCDMFIPYVNEINKYDVPDETHYRYYFNLLPQRSCYFKYIKKDKNSQQENILYIQKYYNCSLKEANIYINMLSSEEIENIVKKYEYGNNKKVKPQV